MSEKVPTESLYERNYRVRSWGPLHHLWWDTQPAQKSGMVEETWCLGPFDLTRQYVRENKKYGSWTFSLMLALRRWRGPFLTISFGSGAQDWDSDRPFWEADDDA